jgi:hypothetical protein
MKYRIKHDNGTYYDTFTPIGPAFGASREDAAIFDDWMPAVQAMSQMPAVAGSCCRIESDLTYEMSKSFGVEVHVAGQYVRTWDPSGKVWWTTPADEAERVFNEPGGKDYNVWCSGVDDVSQEHWVD